MCLPVFVTVSVGTASTGRTDVNCIFSDQCSIIRHRRSTQTVAVATAMTAVRLVVISFLTNQHTRMHTHMHRGYYSHTHTRTYSYINSRTHTYTSSRHFVRLLCRLIDFPLAFPSAYFYLFYFFIFFVSSDSHQIRLAFNDEFILVPLFSVDQLCCSSVPFLVLAYVYTHCMHVCVYECKFI